ncbi:flagellar assembly protein FliH [Paenibacillus sp. 1011MAR3C5]|uniref:FliH/SctL family protein n=1 Tax=Paenibacillus sp. 1011MAR3C5 TaxID=1675787 RepID=UPI000E6B9406|nr:FliH/SctL family protein [Paenibacillus sp. 1011MAR3C5]RJE86750.1 flagellar assembly protein FliH [Paenibacillus sp. 1011MAR3C5]
MSNLIKSSSVIPLDQLKELKWANPYQVPERMDLDMEPLAEPGPDEETVALRDQILADAEIFAENRLRDTAQECEKMLADAQAQIDVWWLEKREADELASAEARTSGYEQGFAEGKATSEAQLRESWESKIIEAADVLKHAYASREQIIQEAEPFLVQLSCAIAEKIIGQQLSLTPDVTIEMIRRSLSRRREQGVITLCVAPSQLTFVQAAREELHASIDSQAELQILPDSSVKDNGCVIRSAYGSIDARIDTQLSEIKRELISLAHQNDAERGHADERE